MTGKALDLDSEFRSLLDRGKTGQCRCCQLPDDLYEFIQAKFNEGYRTWKAFTTLLERRGHKVTSHQLSAHFDSNHYQAGERHA